MTSRTLVTLNTQDEHRPFIYRAGRVAFEFSLTRAVASRAFYDAGHEPSVRWVQDPRR